VTRIGIDARPREVPGIVDDLRLVRPLPALAAHRALPLTILRLHDSGPEAPTTTSTWALACSSRQREDGRISS
jgi:hypothetical protein